MYLRASLVAQTVKNLPAKWEIQVRSLGEEDPLEKEWQPTPVFLPGGRRSLVGYSPQVTKSQTLLSDFTFTLMRTAGFICVCFNSVICVVIFDGHFALSGHHLV